jgi:hypothetical protein
MNFPDFYSPDRIGTLYIPQTAAALAAGQAAHLRPAAQDRRRLLLLLVDPQVDFIHPDGALSVPGAVAEPAEPSNGCTVPWISHSIAFR